MRSALAELAPVTRGEVAAVAATVFDGSSRGAMVACAAVSVAGVIVALNARPARSDG